MQTVTQNPIYLDWQFWAAIVAFIALILSQLPPISQLLRKAKIDVEVHPMINITHAIGNPNIGGMYIIIKNSGGKKIRIKRLSLQVIRDDIDFFELPSQTYLPDLTEQKAIIFTPFNLRPDEEWGYSVQFYKELSRDDLKRYKEIGKAMKENIRSKLDDMEDKKQLVEADQDLVEPLIEIFKKYFKWKEGEYKISLLVYSENTEPVLTKNYSFIIFESDSEELYNYIEEYKYGIGVFYQFELITGVDIKINEI